VIGPDSDLVDVAFAVCTRLERAGITAVLTGGSAATYYAPDAHQSLDLDFVITVSGPSGRAGQQALEELGFERSADYYVHPSSAFPLEFPRGPLMVGEDHITRWSTARRRAELLHLLSPTDCCRDRLAALLFWNDFSGLEQALAVVRARRDEIDLALIRHWCVRERHPAKYALFEQRLRHEGLL
jgi:hypothetical protein